MATQERFTTDDHLCNHMRIFIPLTPQLVHSNLLGVLHLSDCIRNCGPVWVYWQFTMEKMCGNILSWLSGKRNKYAYSVACSCS
ncbi:hypothetical protein V1520DRAFT_346505 [Lipomyces starkeyi]